MSLVSLIKKLRRDVVHGRKPVSYATINYVRVRNEGECMQVKECAFWRMNPR